MRKSNSTNRAVSLVETGNCKYGGKCQFAHGLLELRISGRQRGHKEEICKTYHTIGTCPYGKRCRFIHMEGTPRIWQPTSPLNYLILHGAGARRSSPVASPWTPSSGSSTLLDSPEFPSELAYIARMVSQDHPLLTPGPAGSASPADGGWVPHLPQPPARVSQRESIRLFAFFCFVVSLPSLHPLSGGLGWFFFFFF